MPNAGDRCSPTPPELLPTDKGKQPLGKPRALPASLRARGTLLSCFRLTDRPFELLLLRSLHNVSVRFLPGVFIDIPSNSAQGESGAASSVHETKNRGTLKGSATHIPHRRKLARACYVSDRACNAGQVQAPTPRPPCARDSTPAGLPGTPGAAREARSSSWGPSRPERHTS